MIDPRLPDFTNTPASPHQSHFDYAPADLSVEPYVTIMTPFHNTGPIFRENADSVLRQSFQQWEWLIINDGSTNADALAVLERYRQLDRRIHVIDNSINRGLSAARNIGFQSAWTSYGVQLDSDDLLEPTAIERGRYLPFHGKCF